MSTTQAALLDALRQAKLQIEYLHDKFNQTGSGNGVLAQIDQAIAAANAAPYRAADGCCHKTVTKRCDDCPVDREAAPVLDATGERDRFEEWFEADAMPAESNWFGKDADDDYLLPFVQHAWCAWEARAALIQPIVEDGPVAWKYRTLLGHREWRVTLKEEWARCTNGRLDVIPLYARPQPQEPKPCCGKPEACSAACVERGRWLERKQPQECGTGAMCCYMAAMRDHEEEAKELPVMSDAKRVFIAELQSTEQTMRTEGFPVDAERIRHAIALLSRKPSADKEASK